MEAAEAIWKVRLALVAAGMSMTFGLAGFGAFVLWRARRRPGLSSRERWVWRISIGAAGFVVLCLLWALVVEADWLSVSQHTLHTAKLAPGQRLRIVHLTDLHIDENSRALAALPELVRSLKPDLVVLTGDNLNAERGLPLFRDLVKGLEAPLGRYAVMGNHDVWYWQHLDHFGQGVATELSRRPVAIEGTPLVLCGAPYGLPSALERCLAEAPEGFRIAAYHSPDLIEDLASKDVDLYLAGHTHGGQVRVPLYGALVTMSKFDKAYEMGLYRIGKTFLHVSRGIGFEPHAPRVRFACRPEVAVLDLVGVAP